MKSSENENCFYVYIHRRKSDGEIFYVGKGKGGRAKSRSGRNRWWRHIESKHGFYPEIVRDGLTNSEACDLEIREISRLRKNGSSICNVANGGESGLVGIPLTEQHKNKLRMAKTGKRQSPEHARKSATAKVGKKQPRSAVEKMVEGKRKMVINSLGEIYISATHAAKAMAERYGGHPSQGNVSMVCRGERKEAFGLSWSYDITNTPPAPTGVTASMKKIRCSNGMEFKSAQDAKRWVESWRGKANNQPITECARGESKSAYGFTWEYIS